MSLDLCQRPSPREGIPYEGAVKCLFRAIRRAYPARPRHPSRVRFRHLQSLLTRRPPAPRVVLIVVLPEPLHGVNTSGATQPATLLILTEGATCPVQLRSELFAPLAPFLRDKRPTRATSEQLSEAAARS